MEESTPPDPKHCCLDLLLVISEKRDPYAFGGHSDPDLHLTSMSSTKIPDDLAFLHNGPKESIRKVENVAIPKLDWKGVLVGHSDPGTPPGDFPKISYGNNAPEVCLLVLWLRISHKAFLQFWWESFYRLER